MRPRGLARHHADLLEWQLLCCRLRDGAMLFQNRARPRRKGELGGFLRGGKVITLENKAL